MLFASTTNGLSRLKAHILMDMGNSVIHPDAPNILISAEFFHGTAKRPSEQDRNRLNADANALFNTISFAPLNL